MADRLHRAIERAGLELAEQAALTGTLAIAAARFAWRPRLCLEATRRRPAFVYFTIESMP